MSEKVLEPRPMDIFMFISRKLDIDDVEPMYSAIVRAKLPLAVRQRLCFAEGLADHLGLAARMAEGADFWRSAREFVDQPLRGGARRHFRAGKAISALRTMERRFPDIKEFFKQIPLDYFDAKEFITSLPEFGAFSAFKIADMAERTCGVKVDFSRVQLKDLAKFPRRGADLAADYINAKRRAKLAGFNALTPEIILEQLKSYKWALAAPPHRDRPLNVQEIETCFCNYGHAKFHPPGYETAELRKLLEGFGPLASKIQRNLGGAK